jgi:hypothetical protein
MEKWLNKRHACRLFELLSRSMVIGLDCFANGRPDQRIATPANTQCDQSLCLTITHDRDLHPPVFAAIRVR